MSIAGHDPSGGAGIQADIEAIVSMSCHACTVITAITAQDSRNVYGVYPLPPMQVIEQAQAVLDDLPVDAIKIGLLGSVAIAEAVAALLARHPDIPVVLDPVIWASGGGQLAETQIVPILCERLLPQTTILTPNIHEARQLAQTEDLDACGQRLRELGCEYVSSPAAMMSPRWSRTVCTVRRRRSRWKPGRASRAPTTAPAAPCRRRSRVCWRRGIHLSSPFNKRSNIPGRQSKPAIGQARGSSFPAACSGQKAASTEQTRPARPVRHHGARGRAVDAGARISARWRRADPVSRQEHG